METLSTHYYFFGNQEGDGYEVYFDDYPDVKGFGDTYDDAYEDALENLKRYKATQKEKQMNQSDMMAEALAAYDAKSYSKAIEIWQGLAADNSDAMVNLGSLYAKGEGVARDVGQALEWFEKAFEKGHKVAAFYLGGMYENGIGVPKNPDRAAQCYLTAAEDEAFTTAQVKAAFLIKEHDARGAMELLIKAAHGGDTQAQEMITYVSNAVAGEKGEGVFRTMESDEQRLFVQRVVDKQIVPALASDGGGIEMLEYVEGEMPQIWLRYLGACSGCHLGSTSTADMIISILEQALDKQIVIYLW